MLAEMEWLQSRSQYTSLLLFMLFLSQLPSPGDAGATLSVRMVSYKNPNNRDWYNQACDPIFNVRCDNLFDFCFDIIGGNNNFGDSDCRYGIYRTGEFTNNDEIAFDTDMYGVKNPIIINMPNWQNVRLKVQVRDDDSSHSSHDLVDRFYRDLRAIPAVNGTNTLSTTNMVISGERTSTQKTSLTLEFTVKCDQHYYAADCNRYCRYRDDNSGHYSCKSDGNKECLRGWEDVSSMCTVWSDDCIDNECMNGATCIDGARTYSCRCLHGFTGTHCETEIDECISGPCQNNGTCVNEVGSYHCDCPDAYPASISPTCGIHTCLYDNPCENGGTCYGPGLCQCPLHFTGPRCEMHYCEQNCVVCKNGGVCTGTTCDCPKGTLGERCEIRICDVIECFNGGSCINGSCICPQGYKGTYCHENIDDCESQPCQNRGLCRDGIDSYTCDCVLGYTGNNCEIKPFTTTTPMLKTTKKMPNIINGHDWLTDKPGVQAVRAEDPSNSLTLTMILLVVALFVIIVVLIAILCRERVKRKLKEQNASSSDDAPRANFENPVYTMERSDSRAHPNVYDDSGYLAPQAMGGAMEADNFTNKLYSLTNLESAYSAPPRGPPRPVGSEPIYDQPRQIGEHPDPPPYSPPLNEGAYSHAISPGGAVSMNDIKTRIDEDEMYEELNTKAPLP